MATNPVDRFIGWLNPHAGLARHFARQRLQRAYEAASPRDTWKPRRSGASANADHQADASILRSKARALVQNVPYMRAGLDGADVVLATWRDNVVDDGKVVAPLPAYGSFVIALQSLTGVNNDVSSVIVIDGAWTLYEHSDFKGTAWTVSDAGGPEDDGCYPSFEDWNGRNNTISSVREVD